MADEFIKGLGILTGAGLGWLVLAGWYRTVDAESTNQLVAPITVPADTTIFNSLGVMLMDVLFWFALFGALAFWVLIPLGRQARAAYENRRSAE